MVENVMGKMGALIKARTMMYKAVVQAVILYGRKIWVATDEMMAVLEVFHNRIAGPISGTTARKSNDREWEWALVDAALEVTGIWPIMEYVRRRQATIVEYASGRPIYEHFTGTERMEGSSRFLWWWEQKNVPKQAEREVR